MTPKLEQFSFQDQKVLMRVDFNVPLNDQFEITDDSRIRAALPSINHILSEGGAVIIMSHLGRPKNGPEEAFSLKHIVARLSELTNKEVQFANDCMGEGAVEKSKALGAGEILVLENLRFYKEETKGDSDFARKLASLGDFYVNDAFGTAHRAHASTAIIAEHFEGKKSIGFLMAKEIDNAEMVMQNPKRPFTAIVGGAKVSDKILIVENLLNIADHILVGGGMAYTFFKAQGGKIGNSLCEDDRLDTCRAILKKAEEKGVKIHLPADSIIADKFDAQANTQHAPSNEIADEWMGLDIGTSATEQFSRVLLDSHTILWNGPMGVFEMEAFEKGTKGVAESVARATENGAFSLIGGGDSAAAVYRFGFENQVSYVSTGGGALLEYFEGKQLPGIAAING
ncbi:MAG: phosphoglycerate kinase [Bacteroidia bacterium]|jgi:phosphoglycerate kinase|nr:phosphoglycerate kinase [Bacteroidia bacterium]